MKQINDLSSRKHDIELSTAKKYIIDFRAKFSASNKEGLPYSETFNKDAILKLLNHPECAGLRIFNGLKTEGEKHEVVFILMGIDEKGKNILSTHASSSKNAKAAENGDDNSPALDNGVKNPPYDDGMNHL